MTRIEQLRDAVVILAATADEQAEYLKEFFGTDIEKDHNVDEIALQFSDIAVVANSMMMNGEISIRIKNCIDDLDCMLKHASETYSNSFWTMSGLNSDPYWDEIRLSARRCLSLFGSG